MWARPRVSRETETLAALGWLQRAQFCFPGRKRGGASGRARGGGGVAAENGGKTAVAGISGALPVCRAPSHHCHHRVLPQTRRLREGASVAQGHVARKWQRAQAFLTAERGSSAWVLWTFRAG